MTNKDRILDKIKKCLSLSASSNEHEAAAALRQAHKLMEAHNISAADILTSEVSAEMAKAGGFSRPAKWEGRLAAIISQVFGCTLLHVAVDRKAHWKFVGLSANPEVAQYVFTVLFKKLKKARAEYIKAYCQRMHGSAKTRVADMFCEAWTMEIRKKASFMVVSTEDKAKIDMFIEAKTKASGSIGATDRNSKRKLSMSDIEAYKRGINAGQREQLHAGVGTGAEAAQLTYQGAA